MTGTTGKSLIVLAATLSAAAVPAAAADRLFKPPQGCTVYVTAQLRSCQVSQHYRCDGDQPGDQWSVYVDGEGAHFASKIDAETRWIESVDFISGETDRLGRESDPASFSVLLQSGRDDFDFVTTSSSGEERRFRGYDELTGEKVTVDGVPLEKTRFSLTAFAADGSEIWTRKGHQFISRDWRLFFSDREEFVNAAGERVESVDTPVAFDFPGDKGYLSMDPDYDCDVVTAGADGSAPVLVGLR